MISSSPAYTSPVIGGETFKLEKQQCPIMPLFSIAPHKTGSKLASGSCFGEWQAALMAALQLPMSGMPALYFLDPVHIPKRMMILPRMMTLIMAMQE